MDTDELLARLASKGVKNIEIARVLGLPDSRIPEIKRKERKLKLDEAVKLVRAFGLEQDSPAPPPPPILRLAVQHIALELGAPRERTQALVEDLTEDLRVFFALVSDRKVRGSIESVEMALRAMTLRRPKAGSEVPPGSDPERTH